LQEDTASTTSLPTEASDRVEAGGNSPEEATASKTAKEAEGFSPQTFELGEIPAVKDRFHAILKRRLQLEIQRHPPRFPWETEGFEYTDNIDAVLVEPVPTQLWIAQQRNLELPIPLPEKVFVRLLNQCQALSHSSLQLGAKLVQALEDLFPGQSLTLNELAGRVMLGDVRSSLEDTANFPSDYESTTPPQQLVLSLLAARQMLENLTLPVSATQRVVERQWLSTAGVLKVSAEFQSQNGVPHLRVRSELPCGGSLKLKGGIAEAIAQSSSSGSLKVELLGVVPNQTYPLEVTLQNQDAQPLVFAICPTM
jgi:hypothetical protein